MSPSPTEGSIGNGVVEFAVLVNPEKRVRPAQSVVKNLRFLYQGLPRGPNEPNYLLLPYRLALLKPAEAASTK